MPIVHGVEGKVIGDSVENRKFLDREVSSLVCLWKTKHYVACRNVAEAAL
jgi:hypothetical protein